MPTTYAVIGASRGIGLEYIRQLSTRPDSTVFAVVRSKQSSGLLTEFAATVKNVHVIEGDVSDHPSLQRAAKEIGEISGGKLDYLIHNAARMIKEVLYLGLNDYASMNDLDADFVEAFKVNTLGIVHSIDAFLPLLRAGAEKKIIVIGTGGASYGAVRKAQLRDLVAYCVTKASGTMVTVKYSVLLAPEGFTVVTLSPGVVSTDAVATDGNDADPMKNRVEDMQNSIGLDVITPTVSVQMQLKVIDGLTVAETGKFLAHTGDEFTD